jgi:diguanylate cyclase (GGDEF)-like protein
VIDTTPGIAILIIDDSDADAAAVVRLLESAGYQVRHQRIDDDDRLAEALQQASWDLAIGDYSLRRLSGLTALHTVREYDFDLPFIFVSGTPGEETAVLAMKAGAHDYLRKGDLKRLIPAVRHELRQAAARRKQRRVAQRLAHLAYHDPLTDLPNRALLHDRLAQALRVAHRDGTPVALLVVDLDGFKAINDTYGHRAGDRVLQHMATRIRAVLRDPDTVARLGGDEFAVVLPAADVDGARQAARKVQREIQQPMPIEHRLVTVQGSIGIACFPEHGRSADALLRKADIAMYLAKGDGAGVAVYAPKARDAGRQRGGESARRL